MDVVAGYTLLLLVLLLAPVAGVIWFQERQERRREASRGVGICCGSCVWRAWDAVDRSYEQAMVCTKGDARTETLRAAFPQYGWPGTVERKRSLSNHLIVLETDVCDSFELSSAHIASCAGRERMHDLIAEARILRKGRA